jgi:hypothetical protein
MPPHPGSKNVSYGSVQETNAIIPADSSVDASADRAILCFTTLDGKKITILTKNEAANLTTPEKTREWFGRVLTALAMIPQGGFGMLLMDEALFQYCNPLLRVILDMLMFTAAEEGKRRLIGYFNKGSFKHHILFNFESLSKIDLKKFFDSHTYSWTNIRDAIGLMVKELFVYIPTLIISSTFGGLAKISWEGVTGLLKDYHMHVADELAEVTAARYFQIFFMLSSWIANLKSFPYILGGAVETVVVKIPKPFVTNPEYRKLEHIFAERIHIARNELKGLYEAAAESKKMADTKAEDLFRITKEDVGFGRLTQELEAARFDYQNKRVAYYNCLSQLLADGKIVSPTLTRGDFDSQAICAKYAAKPVAEVESLSKVALGYAIPIFLIVVATWGLSNFNDIAPQAIRKMIETLVYCGSFSQIDMTLPKSALADAIMGWCAYLCMALMGTNIVWNDTQTFLESRKPGRKPLNILDKATSLWIELSSTIICGLGGTPNAYQAMKLAHQSYITVAASGVSSYLLEKDGYRQYTTTYATEVLSGNLREAELKAFMAVQKAEMKNLHEQNKHRLNNLKKRLNKYISTYKKEGNHTQAEIDARIAEKEVKIKTEKESNAKSEADLQQEQLQKLATFKQEQEAKRIEEYQFPALAANVDKVLIGLAGSPSASDLGIVNDGQPLPPHYRFFSGTAQTQQEKAALLAREAAAQVAAEAGRARQPAQ